MRIILNERQIKELKSLGLKEIIDTDGSLISGDELNGTKTIKTNTVKPDGRPQTTDDFSKETGQDSDMYLNRYGFSITEEINEADDFVSNNKPSGFMNKDSKIPDATELSKTYKKPDIQSALTDLKKSLAQPSIEKELQQDINAIVLKDLVIGMNLKPNHKKEIQNMLNGKQ